MKMEMQEKADFEKSFSPIPKRSKGKQEDEDEDSTKDPLEKRVILGPLQMWAYIGMDALWILFGSVGAIAEGATIHMFYLILSDVLGDMSSGFPQSKINKYSLRMTYIMIGSAFASLLSTFCGNIAHDRIASKLKRRYYLSLLRQEIGFFDRKKIGGLMTEIEEHLDLVASAYSIQLLQMIKHSGSVIVGVSLAFAYSWKMTLVLLSTLPVIMALSGITSLFMECFSKKTSSINSKASSRMNEVIGAIRTVRSMDGEEKEKREYDVFFSGANLCYFSKATVIAISMCVTTVFIWGLMPLGTWYGGTLVNKNEISFTQFLKVFSFVLIGMESLQHAAVVITEINKSWAPVSAILGIIQRTPQFNTEGGKGEVTPSAIQGLLEFRGVSFSYPTRPGILVLKDFDLTIQPGQTIALVGASGSGKSTIVGLLEKFYLPDSGTILLDGVDLMAIDSRWLHRNIGIVTQEPTLFATTIRKNIVYAMEDKRTVSTEEIIQAAKQANAHDFIMALPKQYETIIGERGVSLSGGQKQRIAIARAMIQNPSLLLLDEATSALDTHSESLVQEALNTLMRGRTTIVIAHRLSTVVDSDVIYLLDKGELKEMGTHSELMKIENGLYRGLATLQTLSSE